MTAFLAVYFLVTTAFLTKVLLDTQWNRRRAERARCYRERRRIEKKDRADFMWLDAFWDEHRAVIEPTDFWDFKAAIKSLGQTFANLARVPPYFMSTDESLSTHMQDAARAREADMRARAGKIAPSYEDLLRRAELKWVDAPDAAPAERFFLAGFDPARWRDPESRSLARSADALGKMDTPIFDDTAKSLRERLATLCDECGASSLKCAGLLEMDALRCCPNCSGHEYVAFPQGQRGG